jgi:hypothetical protein
LWTAKENQFVQDSINNICKDNPKFTSCIPFTQMKALLDHSCPGNAEKKEEPLKNSLLGLAHLQANVSTLSNDPDLPHTNVRNLSKVSNSSKDVQNKVPLKLKIQIRGPKKPPKDSNSGILDTEPAIIKEVNNQIESKAVSNHHPQKPQQGRPRKKKVPSKTSMEIGVEAVDEKMRPKEIVLPKDTFLPKETIVLKPKRGLPKKKAPSKTSINFQPEPLTDAEWEQIEDWEQIKACSQVYWQAHWAEHDAALKAKHAARRAAVKSRNLMINKFGSTALDEDQEKVQFGGSPKGSLVKGCVSTRKLRGRK